MTNLKKYNLFGDQIGEMAIDPEFLTVECNLQMLKDYIVAINANKRQWSACTKTRSEVKHTTRKPHKQKGTGGARQGSTVSPQYRGGGIVFGPKPKFDQHVKINKKERRLAIHYLLAQKILAGSLVILNEIEMDVPKTKVVSQFLQKINAPKKTLFLADAVQQTYEDESDELNEEAALLHFIGGAVPSHQNFQKSIRNLVKSEYGLAVDVNGYNLMNAQMVIITEAGLQQLMQQVLRR